MQHVLRVPVQALPPGSRVRPPGTGRYHTAGKAVGHLKAPKRRLNILASSEYYCSVADQGVLGFMDCKALVSTYSQADTEQRESMSSFAVHEGRNVSTVVL